MELVQQNALIVLVLMTVLWVVSVVRQDASIVDPWWSMGFLLVTANTIRISGATPGKLLLLAMVAAWAIRLWLHILVRSRGRGEDPRYTAFRERYGPERYWWFSFFQVFLLQGLLVMIISAPLQVAAAGDGAIGIALVASLVVFAAGFVIEATADAQLQSFRNDPSKRGRVLDTGLWGWSRHPNYFGDALLWWGFWLSALDQPFGWATVFAPVLMTFLLVRVSGVSMLDAHMAATKPGYAEYMKRTSSFVPVPPRR